MNILMVSDVYFPRVNGVSTSMHTFRRELQNLGHDITIIAPAYPQPVADEPNIGRVASRPVPFDPEDRLMWPRALERRLAAIRPRQFDLVHVQTPFVAHYAGLRLARRLGVPCIETYHTFFEEYLFHYFPFLPKGVWRAITRRFSRRQCDRLDGLVAPSQAMAEVLTRYGVRARIQVIPTGMPNDAFVDGDGAAFRARHAIRRDQPVLVIVGRVAFEKNIDFLMRVTEELKRTTHPQIALIIAGEGPAKQRLQRLAADLGIVENVRFVGYLERGPELSACYQAGDVFVFASRTETQGLVLLEALSLGVPVVSTAVMGTRDIVGPERGALVAEENVGQFAARVRRVLDDADLRRRLGEEGRRYAREWVARGPAQALLKFYLEFTSARYAG
ncbi:MAG: glycosyltransferase [Candidatus Competibacter sp.]|nr:glycosyltransferase [Candidatus Competibacter sp.]